MIKQTFPGLDLHKIYTDPAQHLRATDTESAVDHLDRELFEV